MNTSETEKTKLENKVWHRLYKVIAIFIVIVSIVAGFVMAGGIIGAVINFFVWGIFFIILERIIIYVVYGSFKSESLVKKAHDKNNSVAEKQLITENHEHEKETAHTIKQKYNKPAVIGLILSIVSIFGIGLAGIAGFILGIVALVQIKHTKEKGKGLAIVAIIIGLIWSFGVGILKRLLEAGY